jgi:hypothetical protein
VSYACDVLFLALEEGRSEMFCFFNSHAHGLEDCNMALLQSTHLLQAAKLGLVCPYVLENGCSLELVLVHPLIDFSHQEMLEEMHVACIAGCVTQCTSHRLAKQHTYPSSQDSRPFCLKTLSRNGSEANLLFVVLDFIE